MFIKSNNIYKNITKKGSFVKECRIYSSLKTDNDILSPKLIDTDFDNYLLITFIDGIRGWESLDIEDNLKVQKLWEFQNSKLEWKSPIIDNSNNSLRRSVVNQIKYSIVLFKQTHNLRLLYKLNKTLIKCHFHQPRVSSLLTHNDILVNVLYKNKSIYFFDFEFAYIENKWILIDIIHIATSYDEVNDKVVVDFKLVELFIEEFYNRSTDNINININIQYRISLIIRMLQKIKSRNRKTDEKLACLHFLQNILLNDSMYYQWIENNKSSSSNKG